LAQAMLAQAGDSELAAALILDLQDMAAAILHTAKGVDASAAASRSLVLKLLGIGLTVADAEAAKRGRPKDVRAGLVGRLAGGSAPPRHETDTPPAEKPANVLPF
jgi:hypothetical protein